MNEVQQNSTMVPFDASRKFKMNSFISWHKQDEIALNNEVAKGCMLSQVSGNRNDKTAFYHSLYSDS